MSDQPSQASTARTSPIQAVHHSWFKRAYHRLHDFDHATFMARSRKYDAHLYFIVVALGVPLMGWLLVDFFVKLVIACVWFAVVPALYFWLEGMEINTQIRKYGLLDQEESDRQRKTMYFLYFGAVVAFVVWVVAIAVYIAARWPHSDWWTNAQHMFRAAFNTPVHYGVVEWGILAHTVLIAYLTIDVYFPLISNFLQATAGQKRVEKETVTVVRPGQ